jgi:small conductance mechanosensitive channel
MWNSLFFLAQAPAPAGTTAANGSAAPSTFSTVFIRLARNLYLKFEDNLPHLVSALIILVVGWWLAGWVKSLLRRLMTARHVEVTLNSFLSQLCYWLIIIVVVLVALQNAQVETTPFSAVLGAAALAVGLAMQNSLMDFVAGMMIIFFRYFRVGDDIEAAGVKGTVEEISIFNTHLKTADNRKIIVSNGKILGTPIINSSAKPTRRLDLTLNISYESNLKLAKQIILTELQNDLRVLPNPAPTIAVDNLGESSVDLILRAWVAIGDYQDLRSHLLEALKLRFDEAGVDIPYPQHEVRVKTEK